MPVSTEHQLRLYNTLTNRDEDFIPMKGKEVTMYTCGPTVYGRPHIGNYSSFLMADLLRRWLEVSGYKVTHVKNITDVGHLVADADDGEDKIEKQAAQEQVDPLEIARKYTEQYLADEQALNLVEPEQRPKATETIKEMLTIIKTLLRNNHAYETDDGIYFDVRSFTDYGKLSGNTLDNLSAGARIAVDENKRHPADFALWKKCVGHNARHLLRWSFDSGERVSTSGDDSNAGFPGWHIECSAMSTKFLGEQIDIHTGGEDNIFPHHECEIAQSECASGEQFVRYWLHKRRIDMGSEKMSKSLGNVLSIDDIVAKGYSPLDLRYYFLSVHYRTQLKFTDKGLDDARKARRKIMDWLYENSHDSDVATTKDPDAVADDLVAASQAWVDTFRAAMNDDLNTPAALAAVFTAISQSRGQACWRKESDCNLDIFKTMVRDTFGCFEPEEKAETDVPAEVLALVDQRAAARAAKDFALSDDLRDQIAAHGYVVKDTAGGQELEQS